MHHKIIFTSSITYSQCDESSTIFGSIVAAPEYRITSDQEYLNSFGFVKKTRSFARHITRLWSKKNKGSKCLITFVEVEHDLESSSNRKRKAYLTIQTVKTVNPQLTSYPKDTINNTAIHPWILPRPRKTLEMHPILSDSPCSY